jgi:DNA-binding Xre family transcriptional regulator
MKTYRTHLNEKLKNKRFRRLYEEERQLAELSVRLLEIREQRRLTQKEVARQAKITQQQLSRLENVISCNINTFLRVCNALGIRLELSQLKKRTPVA